MGQVYGQKSSFSSTDANLRINLEDLITKYEDYKFPILKRLSGGVFKKDVLDVLLFVSCPVGFTHSFIILRRIRVFFILPGQFHVWDVSRPVA